MPIDAINEEEKARLIQLVNEGCLVLQEVDDLKGGLRDTVRAIAEEMDVKPSVLNKAITVAHKAKLTEARADFEDMETILETVGRTL
jgi:transposase-like protein|tara:strand:- start:2444 stop:2704 length:261 start_codon:yes stop_codon:yes gene_type:complete